MKAGMLEKAISGMAIGAIFGGAYGLFRGFVSQPGYVEKLQPRPECFEMDAQAPYVFYELGKFRFYHENAYQEAMHNMDSLFCLEQQLRNNEVKPQLTDPRTATQYAIRCLTQLRHLMKSVKEENIYNEIKKWTDQVEGICMAHVHNVDLICRQLMNK
jgi:hypothetical protein